MLVYVPWQTGNFPRLNSDRLRLIQWLYSKVDVFLNHTIASLTISAFHLMGIVSPPFSISLSLGSALYLGKAVLS